MPDNDSRNNKRERTLVSFDGNTGAVTFNIDFERETIWATQKQMADVFGVGVPAIAKHLSSIFAEGELSSSATISKMEIVAQEGARTVKRTVDHYNLDAIISVGYRVNSAKATEFRKWATGILKDYIVKGFALDDQRFAEARLGAFQELVDRVRKIRTSEKQFYTKITDIFATATDYRSNSEAAQHFFASVQNMMHYAVHGHTAPELIVERIDAGKQALGLTHWSGNNGVTAADAQVAKNYLDELEMKKLELLSEQFLSYAELQAYERRPMTMSDWASKLVNFLEFNEQNILSGRGTVSRSQAIARVNEELKKYRSKQALTQNT